MAYTDGSWEMTWIFACFWQIPICPCFVHQSYRVLHLYTGGSQEVIQTEGPQGSFLPLVDFVCSLICRLSDRYIYIIVYLHLRIQSDPSSQCPFSKGCRLLPCYAGYLDNPHVAASVSGLRVFVIHRKPQPMVGKHRKKTTVKVHHLASSYGVSQHLASSRIIQQRFVAGTVFTTIASNKRTNKSYT